MTARLAVERRTTALGRKLPHRPRGDDHRQPSLTPGGQHRVGHLDSLGLGPAAQHLDAVEVGCVAGQRARVDDDEGLADARAVALVDEEARRFEAPAGLLGSVFSGLFGTRGPVWLLLASAVAVLVRGVAGG